MWSLIATEQMLILNKIHQRKVWVLNKKLWVLNKEDRKYTC